jgi:hypothetical protein
MAMRDIVRLSASLVTHRSAQTAAGKLLGEARKEEKIKTAPHGPDKKNQAVPRDAATRMLDHETKLRRALWINLLLSQKGSEKTNGVIPARHVSPRLISPTCASILRHSFRNSLNNIAFTAS